MHTRPRLSSATLLLALGAATACGGALTITPTTLPNAVQNSPYTATLQGTGSQPVTFNLTSGSLPAGITLNSTTGLISGTPTTAGAFAFTVRGVDSSSPGANVGSQSLTLTVISELFVAGTLPIATAGAAYEATLSADGGVPPYTFTVVGLHAGLGYDATTGSIAGTPPNSQIYSVTITAKDSGTPQQTATATEMLVIEPPNVVITNTSLPVGTEGVLYNAQLTTMNGSNSFTWSISDGLLPDGIALDVDTGDISGTPTQATPDGGITIGISVKDNGAMGYTASKNFDLVINP